MTNGNQSKNNVDSNNVSDLEIYNDNFEIMCYNKNAWMSFVFGMTYLAYGGYLFIGMFGGICEFLLFLLFTNVISYFPLGNLFIYSSIIFYIIITRYICAGFLNSFCLWLDKIKIEKLKKKYSINYKMYLIKKHQGWGNIILLYFVYFIIIALFVFYKRIENGTI
jgi:hypothetical protein